MSYPTASYPAAVPGKHGSSLSLTRSIVAIVCLALAALLTAPAVIAFWGQRTLGDTDRYVAAVAPLADDPALQSAVATKVSAAVVENLGLGPLLGESLRGVVEEVVLGLLKTSAFDTVWASTNAEAQKAMIAALSGQDGAIDISGTQIVLDLSPALETVKQQLVDQGLTVASNLKVPDSDLQFVLLDTPALKHAQTVYNVVNPVAGWLIFAVLALYAIAIAVAPKRLLTTLIVGACLVVTAMLVPVLIAAGQVMFSNAIAATAFAPASEAFYSAIVSGISGLWMAQLVIGAVLAVCAGVMMLVLKAAKSRDVRYA